MRRHFGIVSVVAALLVFQQAGLNAGKKDKVKEGVKASPGEYAELGKYPEMTGKLLASDVRSATVRTEFQTWVVDPAFKPGSLKLPGHLQARQDYLLRQQIEIARIKNIAERQRRILANQQAIERLKVEISRHFASDKSVKNGPYKMVMASRDFELTLEDKVKVRRATLPTTDEKGAAKTYSKEELAKLKGTDPKVPGYEAAASDLAKGQLVQLFLTPPPKDAKKKVDEDDEPIGRPTVRMILILDEDPAPKK